MAWQQKVRWFSTVNLYFIYAHKTFVIVKSLREKIHDNNKEFLPGNWHSFLFSDNEETDVFLMLFFLVARRHSEAVERF